MVEKEPTPAKKEHVFTPGIWTPDSWPAHSRGHRLSRLSQRRNGVGAPTTVATNQQPVPQPLPLETRAHHGFRQHTEATFPGHPHPSQSGRLPFLPGSPSGRLFLEGSLQGSVQKRKGAKSLLPKFWKQDCWFPFGPTEPGSLMLTSKLTSQAVSETEGHIWMRT